jgi:hypothetical protein
MRMQDWADIISDELMDKVRDAEDDDTLRDAIAQELRKALLYGLDEVPVMKVMYEDSKHGNQHVYQWSAKVTDGEKASDEQWLMKNGRKTWLRRLK